MGTCGIHPSLIKQVQGRDNEAVRWSLATPNGIFHNRQYGLAKENLLMETCAEEPSDSNEFKVQNDQVCLVPN